MAYGKRYTGTWGALTGGGTVDIYQKDYTGSVIPIIISKDGVKVTRNFDNWESHILTTSCEITIENNEANYFTLFDLLIATERKYKIVVEKTTAPNQYTLFEGYINTEAVQQRYLHYSKIRLVASSFLSKLENVYPTSFDTIGNIVFINGILEILNQAGSELPVYVSSYLISARNISHPDHSFMNQNGMYNEVFWKNNVDRVDSRAILEQILTTFQCYMYYWDGAWYIEDFKELWKTSKHYVRYLYGVEYSPAIGGLSVLDSRTIQDVHDLVFINTTQTVRVNPGYRLVQIRIKNQPFYNLVVNDFRGLARIGDGALIPYTPLREWRAWQPMLQTLMVWSGQGLPYKTMINSIVRTSSYVNAENNNNYQGYLLAIGNRGIYTKFRFTHEGDTDLSIKWKFSIGYPISTNISFRFTWQLFVYDEAGTLIGFMAQNPEDGEWRLVDLVDSVNITTVSGSEFDSVNYICNVNISIPLKDAKDYSQPGDVFQLGNYICILAILPEYYYITGKATNNIVESQVWYGDILITASIDGYDENVIEGTANTDFIEKLEIEINLADVPNFNYKNGVLEGSNLQYLTDIWYRESVIQRKLVDLILIDKFRTGNVSRQRITANVKADLNSPLRPFSMFTESKQADKKFLLTELIHNVAEDIYELALDEYDNDTEINLIG